MNLEIKTKRQLIRLLDGTSSYFTVAQRSRAIENLKKEASNYGVSSWKNLSKSKIYKEIKRVGEGLGEDPKSVGTDIAEELAKQIDKELMLELDKAAKSKDIFHTTDHWKIYDEKTTPYEDLKEFYKDAKKATPKKKGKPKKVEPMPSQPGNSSLDNALLELIKSQGLGMTDAEIKEMVNSAIDNKVADVKALVTEHVETLVSPAPKEVVVKTENTKATKKIGIQHKDFDLLLKSVQTKIANGRRINIWLHGPPATGKTTAAEKVAEALDLPFYFTGSVEMPFALMGYTDAKGDLVRTPFREAYEKGGVFLFDEIDGSAPAAILALNAAIDGNVAAFPDGMIKKHKDFVCIAGANTVGKGGTSEFSGRSKQDEAFRSRWVFLEWAHDDALEDAIVGNSSKAKNWLSTVRKARRIAKQNMVHVTFSTRASIHGAALLENGWTKDMVISSVLRCGMPDESWKPFEGNL